MSNHQMMILLRADLNFLDLLQYDFFALSLLQEPDADRIMPPPTSPAPLRRTRSSRDRFLIREPPVILLEDALETFHPFPRLPLELQIEIIRLHTHFSISETGDLKGDVRHNPEKEHGSIVFDVRYEERTEDKLARTVLKMRFACVGMDCKVINLPAGLKVNHLVREMTMDFIRLAPRAVDPFVSHCRDVVLMDFRR